MEKLTYKEAFDKITEAYIKDEIKPYDAHFCFCGTLCEKTIMWFYGYDSHGYTGEQLKLMEYHLLTTISMQTIGTDIKIPFDLTRAQILTHSNYENALFNGMCAALEVLKQIHKERGENVEDFQFTKRQLKTCI